MALSDEELVERCLAGEEEAFRILVERYDRRVYAAIRRLVRSEADARDLTQETFLRFFRALSTFDASRSLGAWLLRIASNQTVDFLRKRRVETVPFDALVEDVPDFLVDDVGIEGARAREARREWLSDLVARLSPGFQVVIELRHSQGLGTYEIAEVLDVSPATVRSRLHRAHRQLAGWIRQEDLPDP